MKPDVATMPDLAARARDWSVWLTRQPSVTGSLGEQNLPHLLRDRVGETPAFKAATCWLIPAENDPLARACCAVLVKGEGRGTVLLTGHFDTVTVEDYGDVSPLSTDPYVLLEALKQRLVEPATPAEARAKADFDSGLFLPGRGLLDMKAGLGAGLAALEAFAADPARKGNMLFVAVPDEEVNSVGARALARALPSTERLFDLEILAAVNLDCIGDDGDGSEGRAVALGSVGKLLLTAHVVGLQSHASHPFQGVNAGAVAAALAQRIEWADELADNAGNQPGIAPTLLSMKDSKDQYDVTTPASVFLSWNTLTMGRGAKETMRIFRSLAAEALGEFSARLAERRARIQAGGDAVPEIQLLDAAELFAGLGSDARAVNELARLAERLPGEGHCLPTQNRKLTEAAWRLSGRRGPAVILGFGSLPYPPVLLSEAPNARRLRDAIDVARAAASERSGQSIKLTNFFPGISDMSFLGEAGELDLGVMAANTPAWVTGVNWTGEVANVPTVNIGPWGRDYHTPLERLHMPYAFEVLPRLLLETARGVLGGGSGAR
jgi:arginine utilization protein RocB